VEFNWDGGRGGKTGAAEWGGGNGRGRIEAGRLSLVKFKFVKFIWLKKNVMRRNTLLIDADDTLWENNVFFENLIEDFITLVEPYGFTRAYIRHILNETERKNIRQYGYGVRSFGRSLEETYMKLAEHLAKRETLAEIHNRVVDLERTPPKILDGVPETLAYLTERHRLILFTKGEPAEQSAKVQRSGLQGFFEAIEIVHEKDTVTYTGL